MDIKGLIDAFINRISLEYPLLHIEYDYDAEQDEYIIWHNDSELEFNNSTFRIFIAKLAREYLFNYNIYNFSFGYDYLKAMELDVKKENYNTDFSKVTDVKYTCINDNKLSNYSFKFGSRIEQNSFEGNIEITQYKGRAIKGDYNVFNAPTQAKFNLFSDKLYTEVAWWTSLNSQE